MKTKLEAESATTPILISKLSSIHAITILISHLNSNDSKVIFSIEWIETAQLTQNVSPESTTENNNQCVHLGKTEKLHEMIFLLKINNISFRGIFLTK